MALVNDILERITALETRMEAMETCKKEHVIQTRANETLIFKGIADINERLSRQKGFIAGVVFTGSAIGSVIVYALGWIKH